jgi:hypothetical protein
MQLCSVTQCDPTGIACVPVFFLQLLKCTRWGGLLVHEVTADNYGLEPTQYARDRASGYIQRANYGEEFYTSPHGYRWGVAPVV